MLHTKIQIIDIKNWVITAIVPAWRPNYQFTFPASLLAAELFMTGPLKAKLEREKNLWMLASINDNALNADELCLHDFELIDG